MQIDVLTLFPAMFASPMQESMLKRFQKQGLVTITLHNFRDFATDKHKTVDDNPFGGGVGMILRVDVLVTALESILECSLPSKRDGEAIFLLTPKGETFTQDKATALSKLSHLVLIAGHYEDVDARINHFIDGQLSIGDYVVTGGEIPAMVVIDAVSRLLPGALTIGALDQESFQETNIIEYPQYTKPQTYRNLTVPSVLVSGNHAEIAKWRQINKRKK